MSNRTHEQFKKQKALFLLIAGTLIFSVIGIVWYSYRDESTTEDSVKKYTMDLPSDKEDVHKIWMNQVEEENKNLSLKMSKFEELLNSEKESREKQLQNLENIIKEQKLNHENIVEERQILHDEIERLKAEIELQTSEVTNSLSSQVTNLDSQVEIIEEVYEDLEEEEEPMPLSEWVIEEIREQPKPLNVDEVIPAGTTVKALLVSSVDAPCGVNSSSDPQPIKLRVLDNAHLPRNVQAKLKGSIIIGSAYGNISSERVYMRTERMSKIEKSGEFVETEIAGYITGEDGRYGMRGTVVDKSYKLLTRAGISGFLGGINQYLQATINSQNIAKATRGLPNDVQWDVLKDSSLQGASNALEKLSEYQIKRAEQLLPVIQVGAGRVVDVTFTHNVGLGDLHVKNKIKIIRERSRKHEKQYLYDNASDDNN